MKTIDERLQNATQIIPRRELSDNFTAQIVAEIKASPSTQVHETKENLIMRLFHKPAIVAAAFVALLAMGGTTYAATDGFTRPFNLSNVFSYTETNQKDNSRIVKVETNNCSSVTFNETKLSSVSDQTMLFRTRSDSKTSTKNVLRYIQGYCEYRATVRASASPDTQQTNERAYYLDSIDTVGKELEQVVPCSSDDSGYCLAGANYLDQDQDANPLAATAEAYIKKAYDAYSGNETQEAKEVFKQYVTPELATALDRASDTDTITCSQGPLASLTYGAPQVSNSKVVITLKGSFEGGDPFNLVQVTYDSELGKISSIDCAI